MTASRFRLDVRGLVAEEELAVLHAAAFESASTRVDWHGRLDAHSVTWVTARDRDGRLVGFVNVVGDGSEHGFLLDTMVEPDRQGTGVGRDLVEAAAGAARTTGCRWLHVDYEPRHAAFYEQACGFRPTRAGLRDLSEEEPPRPPVPAGASVKYAHVERERRWLLSGLPAFPDDARQVRIVDHYVRGTRLRLREVTEVDGSVVRKLGHKVRLGEGVREVACTNFYLDDAEWAALVDLRADVLTKTRTLVRHPGATVAIDVFNGSLAGLVLAEIDSGDGPEAGLPASYDVVREVTDDEEMTGSALARLAD